MINRTSALIRHDQPRFEPGPSPARGGAVGQSLLALLVFPVAAAAALAVWNGAAGLFGKPAPNLATECVLRGPLEVKLTERGHLESANNLTLRCRVEWGPGTSILRIAGEGTRVEKDEVVIELDSSRLRDEAMLQQIKLESAEAALRTAQANAEIQKMQNESDIAASELSLTLAQLDLKKYRDAEYPQESHVIQGEIDIAQEELWQAEKRLAFTEKLMKRGFSTTKVLDSDRATVNRARIALEIPREKRKVLDEFAYQREMADKESSARFYENELERVKMRAEKASIQRERNLLAARRTFFIESERHKKLLLQIEACTIYTPRAGMVVYANTPEGGRGSNVPLIFEGAVVRERQPLIHLPDLAHMRVNARIHESKIALVRDGLPVTIRVDARAGETFHGVVEQVSLVPMSANYPNINLKEYAAFINITDESEKIDLLKPGLTAEVEIEVAHLDSVLQAPIGAVIERGGRHFAWALDDDEQPERREIEVGVSNESATQITRGLEEGDEVVLNPRSTLPDEIAMLEQEIPPVAVTEWSLVKPQADAHAAHPDESPQAPAPDKSDSHQPVENKKPAASPGDTASPASAALVSTAETDSPRAKESTDPMVVFNWLDQDHDAKVTEIELPERMKRLFGRVDTNGDKAIDQNEWKKGASVLSRVESRIRGGGGQ